MAAIHGLLKQIDDARLRERIASEWAAATRHRKFGLVFERHLPEVLPMFDAKPKRGDLVCLRQGSLSKMWRVRTIAQGAAECVTVGPGDSVTITVDELLVVRQFGQPIFPALTEVDAVANGLPDGPWHTLIEADNYHALQLLDYLYAGQVDCVYIDPPYNTGARDWKYNNDYVDANDSWRHSKWLAFMERRLHLAKRLLKPNSGALIVTIDEKEYLHLGMLLDQMFPDARIQMVSTMINPASVARAGGFGRSDEYIFFVLFGSVTPDRLLLGREWVSDKGRTHTGNVRWDLLRRSGTNAARADRPGLFYPIYIEERESGPRIARVGDALPTGVNQPKKVKGMTALLPIRKNGSEGNWQWGGDTLLERMAQGRVRIGGNATRGYVIYILKDGEYTKIERGEFQVSGRGGDGSLQVEDNSPGQVRAVPGSQWRIARHDATQYGSRLLAEILPDRRFPFPKSLYAVRDALRFFVEANPNALILDFFAGSGTTLHAINLLNANDGGRRRCILVTNNEVSAEEAQVLRERGLEPGSSEWERQGICSSVTWPRSKYTILGRRDDGSVLSGEYATGKWAEHGKARTFIHIGFVDPKVLEAPARKKQLLSLIKDLSQTLVEDPCPFIVSEDRRASILFDTSSAADWLESLEGQEHISDLYIVAPTKREFESIKAQVSDVLGPIKAAEEEKRAVSAGFEANLAYFKLGFLDKDRVALRRAFREILPLLWLKAGSVGPRPKLAAGSAEPPVFAPTTSNFAVLLHESKLTKLIKELAGRTDLAQLYLVTDSDESFKGMSERVTATLGAKNPKLQTFQLYRDYLSNFMINTGLDDPGTTSGGSDEANAV